MLVFCVTNTERHVLFSVSLFTFYSDPVQHCSFSEFGENWDHVILKIGAKNSTV